MDDDSEDEDDLDEIIVSVLQCYLHIAHVHTIGLMVRDLARWEINF